MTDDTPTEARDAFEAHDAFAAAEEGYRLTTTVFDTQVTASERDDYATDFRVRVEVPTLRSAAEDGEVGEAVQSGWLDTLERRLEDAPMATRASVDLEGFDVTVVDGTVTVTYEFVFGDAARGVAVAKTFVEYVEGTYVEGVVPGYDYGEPVTDLLSAASTDEDGERGGTPL
ncbi:hypothetical protein I7X12_15775 [Halosimplex litoreum]|uniref:Uncharacterized protein n=1 Tax=Halosimplex litoreum TaxID=1198301 RepID=A0A7T3FWY9_9EURY|nr:DUF5813 family protein [Halosimplex litoreum]QPV62186.1 hypothetical protein I7X12_15775 [Halosimplex litoreum]